MKYVVIAALVILSSSCGSINLHSSMFVPLIMQQLAVVAALWSSFKK